MIPIGLWLYPCLGASRVRITNTAHPGSQQCISFHQAPLSGQTFSVSRHANILPGSLFNTWVRTLVPRASGGEHVICTAECIPQNSPSTPLRWDTLRASLLIRTSQTHRFKHRVVYLLVPYNSRFFLWCPIIKILKLVTLYFSSVFQLAWYYRSPN